MYINLVQSKNYHEKMKTKVVIKKVSQGCHKSGRKKNTQTLHSKKVVLCDLKSYFNLRKFAFS